VANSEAMKNLAGFYRRFRFYRTETHLCGFQKDERRADVNNPKTKNQKKNVYEKSQHYAYTGSVHVCLFASFAGGHGKTNAYTYSNSHADTRW
jgi:hypothetical protein